MPDKKELIKEFILKNPNLSATQTLKQIQSKGLGMRKTDFLALFRETKNLSIPSIEKREKSIPIKHRTELQEYRIQERIKAKPKIKKKPLKIPFDQTKFGQMTKDVQKKHKITEKNAIRRVRKLLKIPRKDYYRLNEIDYDILIQYGY